MPLVRPLSCIKKQYRPWRWIIESVQSNGRQHFLYFDGTLEINDPMVGLADVFQNDITIRRLAEALSISICVAMSYLTELLI